VRAIALASPTPNSVMLPVALALYSSDDTVTVYSLLSTVLWMTSCFHIMEEIGPNQRQHVCFIQFARWRHQRRSLPSLTAFVYCNSDSRILERGW